MIGMATQPGMASVLIDWENEMGNHYLIMYHSMNETLESIII